MNQLSKETISGFRLVGHRLQPIVWYNVALAAQESSGDEPANGGEGFGRAHFRRTEKYPAGASLKVSIPDKVRESVSAEELKRIEIGLQHERYAGHAVIKSLSAQHLAQLEPARATEWKQAVQAAHEDIVDHRAAAGNVWNVLAVDGSTAARSFAAGRTYRRKAMALAREGRFTEAIAILDVGRWESRPLWDEASLLIIHFKGAGRIPLTESEKIAKERDAQSPKIRNGVTYTNGAGVWRPNSYRDQAATEIQEDSVQHHRLLYDHPAAFGILTLGGDVIFEIEDEWYRFRSE